MVMLNDLARYDLVMDVTDRYPCGEPLSERIRDCAIEWPPNRSATDELVADGLTEEGADPFLGVDDDDRDREFVGQRKDPSGVNVVGS